MQGGSALVVGAGIAGLATALALADMGVAITVLERTDALEEAGAGVQISPNASRILRRLGLLEALRPAALHPKAIHVRRARDGATLQRLSLADAEERWGAPYLLVHRADLQATLVQAVARTPAIRLLLGAEAVALDSAAERVTVRVRDGRTFDGDLLVGADGIRSELRRLVWADAAGPQSSGRTAWRATIPIDAVPSGLRAPETALWLGAGAHLVHYPLRGGTVVNIVAILDDADRHARHQPPSWSQLGAPELIRAALAGWAAPVRTLLEAVSTWRTWPLYDLPPLRHWTRGRVTLAGDAAHAALPFLAQGAAQAIEDADALARAWRIATTPEAALAVYEAERRGRTERVQRQSRQQGTIYHLGGAAALARDVGMQVLGGPRTLARYDWLYAEGATRWRGS